MKGGYQILDFKSMDVSSSPTINGLYETIETNNKKAMLATNVVVNGKEYFDFFVTAAAVGSSYTLCTGDPKLILSVNSDNVVSVLETA